MTSPIKISSWNDPSYRIENLNNTVDDAFITCLSYEPRSVGAFQKFGEKYQAKMGLILINEEFKKFNKVVENKNIIDNALKKPLCLLNHKYVASSITNPIKSIIEIDKILKESRWKSLCDCIFRFHRSPSISFRDDRKEERIDYGFSKLKI